MRLVLFCLLALVTTPAWADWVAVGKSVSGNITYIDPASIQKTGAIIQVWEFTDLKQRGANEEMSKRYLSEYDCKDRRSRILSISGYSEAMLRGKTLYSDTSNQEWDYVAPDTLLEDILDRVCAM